MSLTAVVLLVAAALVVVVTLAAVVDVVLFRGVGAGPKALWILGFLLFPLIPALVWLVAGRRVLSGGRAGS